MKWSLSISNEHGIYKLPYELPTLQYQYPVQDCRPSYTRTKGKYTCSKAIIAGSIHPNTHGWGRGEAWKLLSVKGGNLLLPIMGLLWPNPGAQEENPTSQPPWAVAWPPVTRVCPLTRLLPSHFWCLVPFLFRKNERAYILG